MTLTAQELGDRQIKKGDEIITVAAGFPTTITPALQYGAVPVFVDVTVPQYNIDVTKLEEALSEKHIHKLWEMMWKRWCHFEQIRNKKNKWE